MLSKPTSFAILLAVLVVPFAAHIAAQDAMPSSGELVKRLLDARGGIAKIKAVQSQRVTGTISFGPGAEGPFVVELKRPGKLHMEVTVQGQTVMRIYDGRGSGWLVNPFSENKAPVAMSGGDLANIADESDFDGPLVDYQAKGNQIESLGKDTIDGKQAFKLGLKTKSGESRTYYVDAETFLLLKWEAIRKNNNQDVQVESFFKDYRDVQGLKFAFEIDTGLPGSNQSQKLTIDKVELNPSLDDSRFGKPEAQLQNPPSR